MDTTASTPVNQHFLDHVVTCSEASDIEASEDILASNGMKLLAKGAKVDARVRERLLDYKLKKPLEASLRVVDGVGSRRIDKIAEALIDEHPLLSRVCGQASGHLLTTALRNLTLSSEVDTLLSVYASQGPAKLRHAVGTALLAAALVRELSSAADEHALLLAGLVHDIGELYIDPAYLQPRARLSLHEWKHVVTHPIVGARVLAATPGVAPQVATAVLHHHERQDGFGYPHGLQGDSVSLGGQALAVAELLMGLMESQGHQAHRASVALKLLPGEFHRALLDRVVSATRELLPAEGEAAAAVEVEQVVRDVSALRARLDKVGDVKALYGTERPHLGAGMVTLVGRAMERCDRIRAALSSTGLDSLGPDELATELDAMSVSSRLEMSIVVRELRWRMAELERLATLRAERLGPADVAAMRRFVDASRVAAPQDLAKAA